jgi:hypothetical protein
MDYINIGSNGFAQVGNSEYYEKMKVESRIVLGAIRKEMPIPEQFSCFCGYAYKSFPHDFGTYHELVLKFDDRFLNRMEDNPDAQDFLQEFWDFAYTTETFDCESEELTALITEAYQKITDIEKGRHLSIAS